MIWSGDSSDLTYREVQIDFTPEIEVLYMLFERSLSIFTTSLKQHLKYVHFQCKIQLNNPCIGRGGFTLTGPICLGRGWTRIRISSRCPTFRFGPHYPGLIKYEYLIFIVLDFVYLL